MTIITTHDTNKAIQEVVNFHSHLVDEGEIIKVKNNYGTKIFKKIEGAMIWTIRPTLKD